MLDTIRDHVANVVGSRTARDMLDGRPAPWTESTRFENGRLIYRLKQKSRDESSVAIADLEQYRFEEGVLYLFTKGSTQSFLALQTQERNFYPGFACLGILVSMERDRATEAAQSATEASTD